MSLFKFGSFVAASGKTLNWKIECDSLTNEDWDCLASIGASLVQPFYKVLGVPRGGLRFAEALRKYENPKGTSFLLVDDVLTTGGSVERSMAQQNLVRLFPDEILVVFDRSRGVVPFPYRSIFKVNDTVTGCLRSDP